MGFFKGRQLNLVKCYLGVSCRRNVRHGVSTFLGLEHSSRESSLEEDMWRPASLVLRHAGSSVCQPLSRKDLRLFVMKMALLVASLIAFGLSLSE